MGITPFFVENVSELQLCAIKLVTAVSLFCFSTVLCTRLYSWSRNSYLLFLSRNSFLLVHTALLSYKLIVFVFSGLLSV